MDTYISRRSKVQHFCLTLVGEARLWYVSLRPINVDWIRLQNQFRKQYSKIGNTRKQLFHALRSFHFDESTEILDSYVTCIRQVATLLGYEDPQDYLVLFPVEDLRQAVEMANRILMKEKIDRQLAGQSSSTPFMNINDGYICYLQSY